MPVAIEPPRRERLVTMPLLLFLLAVSGVLAVAGYWRWSPVSLDDAVRALADGDVDGPKRPKMLRAVVTAAESSTEVSARWAGALAAVALADRAAYDRALARLGPGPIPLAVPADRTFLDLGDPMLGNFALAMWAEAAGDLNEARRRWGQVRAQCRLAPRPLAAELADEAFARLR